MKKTDISEELWFRYLDGKTNEEETGQITRLLAEDDALLEEYLSVREAALRTDVEPCQRPDLELARKQINESLSQKSSEKVVILPRPSNTHKLLAVAAGLVVLVGVALFFLFRPDHIDNNFAQQEEKHIESEVQTQSPGSEATPSETKELRQNDTPSNNGTEGVQSEPSNPQEATFTTQKIEKNYTTIQDANSLIVTKPNKDIYRVLCKNLEKTLNFEWSAKNVKTLRFVIMDSKGKRLAETDDVAADQYALKYSDIYPEQKLKWTLSVVFEDGTQETRSGRISIDYEPNTP